MTPYIRLWKKIYSVLYRLYKGLNIVLGSVSNNDMIVNPDKFQAIFLGTKDNDIVVDVRSTRIQSSKSVKLLGVTIDDQLSFYPITYHCNV